MKNVETSSRNKTGFGFVLSSILPISLVVGVNVSLCVCPPSKSPSQMYSRHTQSVPRQLDLVFSEKNWGIESLRLPSQRTIEQLNKEVVVAVIDTGLDINHPSFKGSLWVNPGESGVDAFGRDKATNQIDDDGNGFVDDVHGWNFVSNNNDISDHHGHGTHVAGIIGAKANTIEGMTGVHPQVKLMILKYFDTSAKSGDPLEWTIQAIRYATQMNVHIVNYSGGGNSSHPDELLAIADAERKGILFVAAAGNEKSNSDYTKYFPASYGLSNILSVAAYGQNRQISSFSNYGVKSVDIAAPGEKIYSTLPGGRYGYMSGTSQATAFVSGTAALLLATNSNLQEPSQVIRWMIQTGDQVEGLTQKTKYGVQINIGRALDVHLFH